MAIRNRYICDGCQTQADIAFDEAEPPGWTTATIYNAPNPDGSTSMATLHGCTTRCLLDAATRLLRPRPTVVPRGGVGG